MRARPIALLLLVTLAALPGWAAAQDGPEATMLARINQLRADAGLTPLARDSRLDSAARAHTGDMASRAELFHVSASGETPIDRAHAAGIESADIAENVAMHHTLEQAQASLEASSAHLANMVSARSTHVGLSAITVSGGVYITQLFARLDVPAVAAAPPPSSSDSVVALDVPVAPAVPDTITPGTGGAAAVAPQVTDTPAPAAAPEATGGAVVLPPDPSGVVRVPAPAPGVSGYWICAVDRRSSRWYYYPVRPGATGPLTADLSVSGPPPGYGDGPCTASATAGATTSVPPGSSTYGSRPPPAAAPPPSGGRTMITPWGTVRVETRPRRR